MFSNHNFSSFLVPRSVEYRRPKETLNPDGSISYDIVECVPNPLPDYTEYDLEDLIKAGVSLEAVNTSILGNIPLSDKEAEDKFTDIISKYGVDNSDNSNNSNNSDNGN